MKQLLRTTGGGTSRYFIAQKPVFTFNEHQFTAMPEGGSCAVVMAFGIIEQIMDGMLVMISDFVAGSGPCRAIHDNDVMRSLLGIITRPNRVIVVAPTGVNEQLSPISCQNKIQGIIMGMIASRCHVKMGVKRSRIAISFSGTHGEKTRIGQIIRDKDRVPAGEIHERIIGCFSVHQQIEPSKVLIAQYGLENFVPEKRCGRGADRGAAANTNRIITEKLLFVRSKKVITHGRRKAVRHINIQEKLIAFLDLAE